MVLRNLIFLISYLLSFSLIAQDLSSLQKEGEKLLAGGQYDEALPLLLSCYEKEPGNARVATNVGICLYETGQLAESETYLYRTFQSNENPPPETWLYLGKVHHAKLEFETATRFYKSFLKNTTEKTYRWRNAVKDDIRRCKTGILVRRQKPKAVVSALPWPVNSEADDFRPLPSPNDNNRIYFSSTRSETPSESQTKSNMYFAEKTEGSWQTPQFLNERLNSRQHEVALDFDKNGSRLYFFRGQTLYSGDMLIDTFHIGQANRAAANQPFQGTVQTWNGDCDPFFFDDQTVLFASRRAGGYGGLDLYISTLNTRSWSEPINLGPPINTAYDEKAPFLARDGRTLYFSTNHPNRSIGGLDIQKSVFLERNGKWIPVENIGIPFNSAADDEHFFLSEDGWNAWFDSSAKNTMGKRDLYEARFSERLSEQSEEGGPVTFQLARLEATDPVTSGPAYKLVSKDDDKISIEPLYGEGPFMPLDNKSYNHLQEWASRLTTHPGLKVTFVAHTNRTEQRNEICRAALQQVADFLKENGVPLERIRLLQTGPKFFPPGIPASADPVIEIYPANPEVLPVEVIHPEKGFFRKVMTGLAYMVSFPIHTESDLQSLQTLYPDGMLMNHPADDSLFFIRGLYLSWFSAKEAQRDMQQSGFSKAIAAPYVNGWELTKNTARLYVSRYPELVDYINK